MTIYSHILLGAVSLANWVTSKTSDLAKKPKQPVRIQKLFQTKPGLRLAFLVFIFTFQLGTKFYFCFTGIITAKL